MVLLIWNGVTIEIPSGGITLKGHGFNYSKFITTDENSVIFTSAVGGSGDVFISSMSFEIQGTNSKLFEIIDSDGFHAIEFNSVNFNNCNSLGYIENYRQGLETNTGRFGGTPSLEFRGVWLGGYNINVSIIRNVSNTSFSIFKSALGHLFNSRFGGNINMVLPSNVIFYTGTESNFVNDASLQFRNAFISGDGTLLSGITSTNRKTRISDTDGVLNTYVGANWVLSSETPTTFLSSNTETKVNGDTTYNNLVWFGDGGGNNSITVETTLPIEVYINFTGNISGGNNKVITLLIKKYTALTGLYSTLSSISLQQMVQGDLSQLPVLQV